jgi:hypothetical protein
MKIYKEYEEQKNLMVWWNQIKYYYKLPEHYLLWANRQTHKLTIMQQKRASDEGMLKGIPDLTLAVPNENSHGLYIEMKAPNLKPKTDRSVKGGCSDEQLEIHKHLRLCGYQVSVCYSAKEAQEIILNYLRLKRNL